MSTDLRDAVSADEFWNRLNAAMGQDGLISYRYIGRKGARIHGLPHDSVALRRDMRNSTGGIMAAPIAIGIAETGGFTDFNALPAPIVAGFSILDDARDVKEIWAKQEVVHLGRSMGFSRSVVFAANAPSRVIAVTRSVAIKVGEAPPSNGSETFPLYEEIPDSPHLPPLHQAFGAYRRDDGIWELPPLNFESSSTSGSLHLGPIHIVFEIAAMDVAAAHAGTDRLQVEDWEVMFAGRGVAGPFWVRTEGVGGRDRVAVRLTLIDEGKNQRVVAACNAVFRPVP